MEHPAVYERLVQAARAREFVHYGELARMLGIDMDNPHFGAQVGKVLGQISEDEIAAGRPMISAIVVSKDDMLPGKGFFKLGQELHRVETGEDEIGFAVRQIKLVHDYWSVQPVRQPDADGYNSLVTTFQAAGLPLPPVPVDLRERLQHVDEWTWSSRDIDAMEMYMFQRYPAELAESDVDDYVAISHAGHGVNSYGLTVHLVHDQLALFTQAPYGGAYNDPDDEIVTLKRQFERGQALLELASQLKAGGPGRLVVIESTFRGARVCGWLPPVSQLSGGWRAWVADNSVSSFDPLSAGAGWLLSDPARAKSGTY